MVGNVWEWVADWWQPPVGTGDLFTAKILPALYGNDAIFGANGGLLANQVIDQFPGAIQRGGNAFGASSDGVFIFFGDPSPAFADWTRGFRCGK